MKASISLKKTFTTEPDDDEVSEVKRYRPVKSILDSKTFRQELENITKGHAHPYLPSAISATPSNRTSKVDLSTVAFHRFHPIADLAKSNVHFEKGEKNLRCKLSCVFRLIDILEWEQCHGTLITVIEIIHRCLVTRKHLTERFIRSFYVLLIIYHISVFYI